MSPLDGVVYGLIQGVSEFLPVSSSAHLALLPYILKIQDPGVAFDLAMHLGTALAVIFYFYRDIIMLLKSSYILNYIVATSVTVLLVLFIKDFGATLGRNPYFIAMNLLVFGWFLYWADRRKVTQKSDFRSSYFIKESLLIGFSQAMAIFPGVSRSGITLTISRSLGFSREESGRFSFLLSLPIILGGMIFKIPELTNSEMSIDLPSLLMGVSLSFITGLIVIHFFFKLLSKLGFIYFALYRTALAIIIFLVLIS